MLNYHWQDCCETVYADFNYIKQYNALGKHANKNIFEVKFMSNFYNISKVKGEGFIIKTTDKVNNTIFVPCYNIQNGYYSDNLELLIFDNNIVKINDFFNEDKMIKSLEHCERIDITDCHTEQYY